MIFGSKLLFPTGEGNFFKAMQFAPGDDQIEQAAQVERGIGGGGTGEFQPEKRLFARCDLFPGIVSLASFS